MRWWTCGCLTVSSNLAVKPTNTARLFVSHIFRGHRRGTNFSNRAWHILCFVVMEYYNKKTILNSSQQKLSQARHALFLIIVFSTPLENHVPLHNTSQASEANQANSTPGPSHPTLDLVTSTPTATLLFSSTQLPTYGRGGVPRVNWNLIATLGVHF